jgi:hypothetical protein
MLLYFNTFHLKGSIMNKKLILCLSIACLFPVASEAGERTRSGSSEGKRGTTEYQKNWNRETGTGTSTRTTTNKDGKTATTSKNFKKNEDVTVSVTGTRQGFKGNTQTMENTITKTDDGYTSNKTITGSDGRIITRTKDVSRPNQ